MCSLPVCASEQNRTIGCTATPSKAPNWPRGVALRMHGPPSACVALFLRHEAVERHTVATSIDRRAPGRRRRPSLEMRSTCANPCPKEGVANGRNHFGLCPGICLRALPNRRSSIACRNAQSSFVAADRRAPSGQAHLKVSSQGGMRGDASGELGREWQMRRRPTHMPLPPPPAACRPWESSKR